MGRPVRGSGRLRGDKMKYLSVCSGIEAATVAWHGLGWNPVAFAEIEAFPAAVLAHHYPEVPNLGDLTKYREWPEKLLADVDLLVGGTPCQAFSVAGHRRSLEDERGNLSLVYVNLYHHINEVRKRHGRPPAIALWENVPGVLSTKDNAFGCFIGGLLGCDEAPATESGKWDKAGFLSSETVRVGYRVLDAQYFGVAQRRRRVFLAAVPCELVERFGERACPSEILSLRESVLGNPPSRGAAWEGAARATSSSLTSSGRGVERPGESRGQDDVVIAERIEVSPTMRAMHHIDGNANAGGQLAVAFGGNRTSGPLDVATPCLANGSPHGRQDFASETFVACFHPTQDPISSTDGSAHAMGTGSKRGSSSHAVCVTGHQTHALTTRAWGCEDGSISGCAAAGVAIPINADSDRQNSAALTPSPDAEGRVRLRDPGIGIGEDGDPMFTMQATKPHAVAFKPGQSEAAGGTFVTEEFTPTMQAQNNGSTAVPAVAFKPGHYTRGKSGAPSEVAAPLLADADKGDQDTVVFTPFTKAKRAQSKNDDESWVPGEVAPTQNQFDQGDTRATTVVAFANRTRDGIKVPEVMKDGVVPALTNPGNGGRADAVNIQQAMQVRRLCPSECEALQGFPENYTLVTYRGKPACDGPRYRALGNSMAVPCMWWLGHRIAEATG